MNKTVFERFEALVQEQEFAAKVHDAQSTQEVLAIMKDHGIDATEADLLQVMSGMETMEGELDEAMLDGVAGGGKILDWLCRWIRRRSKKNEEDIDELIKMIQK